MQDSFWNTVREIPHRKELMQPEPMKYIDMQTDGRILTVWLNNPPNNYLPGQFFVEMDRCRKEHMVSDQIDAVIISARGRTFSKGADINEIKSGLGQIDLETIRFGNDVFTALSRLNKPVIAAVNGPCFGGGLELALCCHLRVCSEKAMFGLPEVTAGVIPGLGGIPRLIETIGHAKALEMVLLGDIIPASQALQLNLVSRVFEKAAFWKKTLLFVKTILSARKEAVRHTIEMFDLCRIDHHQQAIEESAKRFSQLISTLG